MNIQYMRNFDTTTRKNNFTRKNGYVIVTLACVLFARSERLLSIALCLGGRIRFALAKEVTDGRISL